MSYPEVSHLPLGVENFKAHIRPNIYPPLDTSALSLDLLQGSERNKLKTVTDGDWTLLLRYRGKEAYVASLAETEADSEKTLCIAQLQGACGKTGYRVISGINVLSLLTEHIGKIAKDPINNYDRIVLPSFVFIQGIIDATDSAIRRYQIATEKLELEYLPEQQAYVKQLKPFPSTTALGK